MASSKRRGNCYATCEALYHLLGGKKSGWTSHMVKHEGDTHWYLVKRLVPLGAKGGIPAPVGMPVAIILDPTSKQFKDVPDYQAGRGCGFLTKEPSKRAREMMEAMLWQSAA